MNQREARIRDYLCQHLEILEPGLLLVEKEFRVPNAFGAGGFIDILAKDDFGHFVVIEIKRSDQAARAALHELTKYVALLKSAHGLPLEKIRVLLLSTEWHELAVPFSEYLKSVEAPTEGLVIEADEHGCVSGVRRFEPVTLDQPLRLERAHAIHLYRHAEQRDEAVDALAAVACKASIRDFVILSVSYMGSKTEVIYPHGAYFAFSAPVDYNDQTSLDRFISKTGMPWEDLDEPSENFQCWIEELTTFVRDSLEIGYPEKLAAMTADGWDASVVHRAGRYATNSEVLSDKALIAEIMRVEGGAIHYLYRTSSPKFRPSWQAMKKDVELVVGGCAAWEHILNGILERAESSRYSPTISIHLFNPGDLVIAMAKAFGADDMRYFPSLQVIESSSESVRMYVGALRWSGISVDLDGDEFFTLISGSVENYFMARHYGEHYAFYDQACDVLGIESIVYEIESPGTSSELIRLIRGPDAQDMELPQFSLANFFMENKRFGSDFVNKIKSFAVGLV